jgi:hypothetical protein
VPAKTREIKLADADPQPIKASFDALTMAPVIPNSNPHCQAICLEGLRRNKTMNTAAALGNSTVLSPKETHCQFIYFSSFDDFSSPQRLFHDVGMGIHIQ